jgi:hypothetical protein
MNSALMKKGRNGPGWRENKLGQGIGINATKGQGLGSKSARLYARKSSNQNHTTGATVGMRSTSWYAGIKLRTRGYTGTTEGDGGRKQWILGLGQMGVSSRRKGWQCGK